MVIGAAQVERLARRCIALLEFSPPHKRSATYLPVRPGYLRSGFLQRLLFTRFESSYSRSVKRLKKATSFSVLEGCGVTAAPSKISSA